ncbi:MAG: hypothetical protein ACYDEJ_00345 [Desulfitobacteriaceae bacterium]
MSGKKRNGWKYLPVVFLGSFVLAATVGFSSELLMRYTSIPVACILIMAVIGTGVVFDIVGIAATAATEAPHHARAANRVFGARQAVYLVRNADKVANFTNDIVGDIAGTLSGVMVVTIMLDIVRYYPSLQFHKIWLNTGMLAFVASVNITGKALGKTFAVHKANYIIGMVGGIIASLEKVTGRSFTQPKKRGGRKNGTARRDS